MVFLYKILAFLISIAIFFVNTFGFIVEKPKVDLEKFELVWSDEFDGEELDSTKWKPLYTANGNTLVRKGGYWNADMISVKDGNLHISTVNYPDGYKGNGLAGWYTGAITTRDIYEQTYGYFEIRCILPKGYGVWSAFWLNSLTMSNVDSTGIDGAEIDIYESAYYPAHMVSSNVHIDGYEKDLKSQGSRTMLLSANNPYEEYNTYGLEWNKDEYIFYINGEEVTRSDFGGASQAPEYLIASVEVGGANGVADKSWAGASADVNTDGVTDYIVDYVRVYQYK